ncbi:MAG: adenylosuccinate synthase [candidate division Zixibacteria bacterium]|nr:adenylosuccinate synthase [candidate division Zixibacteria bacterium]
MPNRLVVGTQWGDEGKGKIVDILTREADIVARYSGGANAGHTVVIDKEKFILHLVPTGILHKRKICVIGNGMVVDLEHLFSELEELKKRKITYQKRLLISPNAHLVMPYHKVIERLEEEARGKLRIGTTLRGIGPAYRDKAARCGIRMADLLTPQIFGQRVEWNLRLKEGLLSLLPEHELISLRNKCLDVLKLRRKVKPLLTDVGLFLDESTRRGKRVLFEGSQGTLLDVDFGTYPYCTSSSTTIGGVCTGLGISPTLIGEVIGVVKSYTTRVGSGPFPTEEKEGLGELLREKGNEFGATTGRPRRCGWLDLVQLKYSFRINGVSKMVVTKLDVLDGIDKIKVCVGYRYRGKTLSEFLPDLHVLESCRPIYREFPGWQRITKGITSFKKLPDETRRYVDFISKQLKTPILMISTGDRRDQVARL